jgi:FkbM family methyltransferase
MIGLLVILTDVKLGKDDFGYSLKMTDKKICIEVGANSGEDTIRFLQKYDKVISFEPHPDLYRALCQRFSGYFMKRELDLYPYAISDYTGRSFFNISDLGDKGTSSLYDYHPQLLKTPLEQYAWYKEGFSRKAAVYVFRLDKLLCDWDMQEDDINYLHIDAQGSDFKVLKGLGNRIYSVVEGRCECTLNVPIYNESDNNYEDVKKYLEDRDFEVTIDYVHAHDSEIDLSFKNKRYIYNDKEQAGMDSDI